jgi:excisionase family DNA binding protein
MLLTVNEAAAEMRVSRGQIYMLLRAGKILPTYVGCCARISRTELERFVRRNTTRHRARPRRVRQPKLATPEVA